MKLNQLPILAALIVLGCVVALPTTTKAQEDEAPPSITRQADGQIKFSFVNAPWKTVIEWFAKQADFSLQPLDSVPEGTFEYHDDDEYSVMEALDQLNYALGLKGYTLIRNRRMLVLTTLDQRIPDDLIETIQPEQLYERGKHEVLKCVFDWNGLEQSGIEQQIGNLISRNHRDAFHVVPSAGQMIVRESGQTLRTIDAVLNATRTRISEANQTVGKHELIHIDPETILLAAQFLLDLDPNTNRTEDGQLKVMVEPLTTRLVYRGSPDKIKALEDLITQLDVAPENDGSASIEKPYLKQYPARGDLEMVFKVCQTMLANRDVIFDIDRSTGNIIFRGRSDDHAYLSEVLREMESGASDFAVVDLLHLTTSRAITMLEQIYQRDTISESEGPPQGPVFFADDTYSRVVIKGTPQEVDSVRRYLQELDVELNLNTGPRSTTRIIDTDGTRISAGFIEDIFATTNRPNGLRIVMPRGMQNRRVLEERGSPQNQSYDGLDNSWPDESQTPRDDSSGVSPDDSGSNKSRGQYSNLQISLFAPLGVTGVLYQDTQDDESYPRRSTQRDDEAPSVPGADIEVKITEYGIVLKSDDLDALDELEAILRARFGEISEFAQPAVFYLRHRKPKDAKLMLEKLIGVADSGGASDPLSSLLGAGINNMIPGMGDLLGGGGSSGSTATDGAAFVMEGTVTIHADVVLQSLIVSATERDMAVIEDLIVNYIDQPGAPQDPLVQGETYRIPIVHRTPTDIKTIIEQQLPDLIRTAEDQSGASNQGRMEAQMLQALLRGGRGGGQQAEEEAEMPKAVLGVDEQGSALLVTGPPFIYERVLRIVDILDTPEQNSTFVVMPLGGVNGEMLARSIKASLGDKIEIAESTATTPGSTPSTPGTNQPQGGGGNQMGNQQIQEAINARNEMMRAIQQQMQRGQQGRGGDPGRGGGTGRGGGGGDRGN